MWPYESSLSNLGLLQGENRSCVSSGNYCDRGTCLAFYVNVPYVFCCSLRFFLIRVAGNQLGRLSTSDQVFQNLLF